MSEPKTWAEKLDAAETGEDFGNVLNQLFVAAFKAKQDADDE
jgi:hypothetical protein